MTRGVMSEHLIFVPAAFPYTATVALEIDVLNQKEPHFAPPAPYRTFLATPHAAAGAEPTHRSSPTVVR